MSIACTYRGVGYGFELPPGYRECEYLESTGTQWIDTGHYATHLSGVHIRYAYLRLGNGAVFGGRKDNSYSYSNEAFAFISTNNGGGIGDTIFIGQNRSYIADRAGNVVRDHIYDAKVNVDADQKVYLDGAYYFQGSTTSQFTQTVPTLMFAARSNYSSMRVGTVAIYSCTIYDNTIPIMNFVPCLDYNGTPCMYDTIGRKTFYNAGTGTFNYRLKPLPFPNGYTELEYLESTSTTYIDTGVYPSLTDMRFECKVQCTNGYNYGGICAIWDNRSGDNRYYLCYVSNSSGYGWLCSKGILLGANAYPNAGVGVSSPIEYAGHIKETTCDITIDGTTFTGEATNVNLTSTTLPLFTSKTNGGIENVPGTRLWYAKLYKEGELVRDFLPYLDSEGVPCMVDVLTGTPYYNAGTGTFNYKLK